jgi:hypothetical protein
MSCGSKIKPKLKEIIQEWESTHKNWANRTSLPKPEKIKKRFGGIKNTSYLCRRKIRATIKV